jgi:hypothetical protein
MMSFTFMAPNTWSVNWPPGTWRMCSSSRASSSGELAREKLRRLPSLSRKSMYWPGRNWRRSLEGSLSQRAITSSASFSIFSMRQGRVLMGISLAAPTSFTSMTRSVSALAQQNRARPLGLVLLAQGAFLEHAVVHGARQYLALAGAAGTVATAVGQGKARVQGGGQQGFAGLDGKLVAAGLDGDLVRHDQFLSSEYADSNCRMR